MSKMWTPIWSDTINSVSIYDTIQWYGTNQGAFEHFGPLTKDYWDYQLTDWEGIINQVVTDIEKDDAGNIWIGTEKGINIITGDKILKYGLAIPASDIAVNPSYVNAYISWTSGNSFNNNDFIGTVYDMQKDLSGNIWIASNIGVETCFFTGKRVVFVSQASSGTIAPINNVTYIANTEFKKGTALGNWFCVYNGNGNNVEISELTASTNYRVAVFEYYGKPGSEIYSLVEGSNNPINFSTNKTGNTNMGINNIKAFPIPFNDFVSIHFKAMDKNYHATIYNTNGKIYKNVQLWENNQRINTSDLAKGIYFLKISDGDNEEVIKIIK